MKPVHTLCMALLLGFLAACSPDRSSRIQDALDRGAAFLRQQQRADGALCDSANPLFDTWETILAAQALHSLRGDTADTVIQAALRYLRAAETPAGLVCHNWKCREAFCLETSAEYFILLSQVGDNKSLANKMETVIRLQDSAGYWDIGNPDVREQTHFPSVTGFVLTLLRTGGRMPRDAAGARAFLLSAQNPYGDWGSAWEYYDCPAYALRANVRALAADPDPQAQAAVRRARAYMLRRQQDSGAWEGGGTHAQHHSSPELQTALMLSALQCLPADDSIQQALDRGVDFLLGRQAADGSWDGGIFPVPQARYTKKEYMFATSLSLQVLHHYHPSRP